MALSAGMDMMMLAPKDDKEVYKYVDIVKELLLEGELHEARFMISLIFSLGSMTQSKEFWQLN